MSDKMYSIGKIVVSTVAGLLAAEAVSICGQALASDTGKVLDAMRGTIAKPAPVKPGLFGRKKVGRR